MISDRFGPSAGSLEGRIEQKDDKNRSSQGVVSLENMVSFVKESIDKSSLQITFLTAFHSKNQHLIPEQINFVIERAKATIRATDHSNHAIDDQILECISSDLIEDSIDLAKIADKECVFHFLKAKHANNLDVSSLKDVYFQDLNSAKIFSQHAKEISLSLNNQNIKLIFHFLNELKNNDHYPHFVIDGIFLDILAASNLSADIKAAYFKQVIQERGLSNQHEIIKLISKFPSLNIEEKQAILMIEDLNLIDHPTLLSSAIQYFGIKSKENLYNLFTQCYKNCDFQSTYQVIQSIGNFIGDDSSLAFALISELLSSEPESCVGPFLNNLGLKDEQIQQIFQSALKAAADRNRGKVINQLGMINLSPESRLKIIEDLIVTYPDEAATSINSLGLDKIPSSGRLRVMQTLISRLENFDSLKMDQAIDSLAQYIRFLEFDDQEFYLLTKHLLHAGLSFGYVAMEALKYLTLDTQLKLCTEADTLSLKDIYKNAEIPDQVKRKIEEKASVEVIQQISTDFLSLKESFPETFKGFIAEAVMLQENDVPFHINNLIISDFAKALFLVRLCPKGAIKHLSSLKLTEEQKMAIIKILVEIDPEIVLTNIYALKVQEPSLANYLINLAMENKKLFLINESYQLFGLLPPKERFAIGVKILEENPWHNVFDYLDDLQLEKKDKISFLIASKIFSRSSYEVETIVRKVEQGKITPEELGALLENELKDKNLEIFFKKTIWKASWWGPQECLVKYLNDDDKDRIVKQMAEIDWDLFLANANLCEIKGQTFLDLAKKAKLQKDNSLNQILHLATQGHGIIIASNIKELNIEEVSKREEIANIIAQQNIKDLVPFLGDFDLQDKGLLEEFAKKAADQDPENFLKHIDAFKLDDSNKLILLEKIANVHPQIAAEHSKHIQFQAPKVHQTALLQIALMIYRQDPSAMDSYFKNFGLANPEQFLEAEVARIKTLMEKKSLCDLDVIKFKGNKVYLERIAIAMLEDEDRENRVESSYWICSFLEQAARQYQREGNHMRALELRLLTRKVDLDIQGTGLEAFDNKTLKEEKLFSDTVLYNFGATFNGMDSQSLKGQNFRIRDVQIDSEEKRIVDFKVAYWMSEDIVRHLEKLDISSASQLLNKNITLKDETSVYYPFEGGSYNTQSPTTSFTTGPIKVIYIEGVGKIEIGMDPYWGSESNKVKIVLDKDTSLKDLQEALALLGLTSILIPANEEDEKRLKINSLVHFFHPKFSVENDRFHLHHLQPVEDLITSLRKGLGSDAVDEILGHLETITEHETVPGEKHICLNAFSEQAEALGARATMCGIGWKKDFQTSAERLAGIMNLGLIATQQRYESGMLIAGASPIDDFRENAADSVFLRLITQKAIDDDSALSTNANLGGNIQIYPHVKVLNYMPYFHKEDAYGARNPHSINSLRREAYENRPRATEFISGMQRLWVEKNEVMLKKRLSPDHITVITYQDPRKIVVADIIKAIMLGTINSDFFDDCNTDDDKVKKVSTEPDRVMELLEQLSDYNASNQTYKTFDITKHWTIDPRQVIEDELNKQKCFNPNLVIIEAGRFSEIDEHLKNCNSIAKRSQVLEQKVLSVAGKFASDSLSLTGSESRFYIDEIKSHLEKLSKEELKKLVTSEARNKIRFLQAECNKHLTSLDFSGQDSLNRELLTSDWNIALHDPDVIIALFALDEMNKRANLGYYENDDILFSTETRSGTGSIELSIPECIAKGLEQHPAVLEKLPLNIRTKTTLPEIEFMQEYIKRSNIQSTFIPVLHAIEKACLQLNPEAKPEKRSDLKPYSQKNWANEYLPMAHHSILGVIPNIDEAKLLRNRAGYSPDELRAQVLVGLKSLLKKEKKDFTQQTKKELVQTICNSMYLIDPIVSHLFFDRLHFLAALTCSDHQWSIETSEGPFPVKDLFIEIMGSFKNDQNITTSIAAEQFYLRLIMANETIENINKQ